MNGTGGRLLLFLYEEGDGKWDLRTDDLARLRRSLGGDVLAAFLRCYVHADRLDSLISWWTLSYKQLQDHQTQLQRNHVTFVWFVTSVLRELFRAVTHLGEELKREGLRDEALWDRTLRAWETDFPANQAVIHMRDKGGSHVDLGVIRDGLDAIEAGNAPVTTVEAGVCILMAGDHHERRQDSACKLGSAALLSGLGWNLAEVTKALEDPKEKLDVYTPLTKVFYDVLKRKGIPPVPSERVREAV